MRDFLPLSKKKCYACLNWDGDRTVYNAEGKVKVDVRDSANCRVFHQPRSGHQDCDKFNPIR